MLLDRRQTCKDLGIVVSVLNRWRKEYSNDSSLKTKDKPSYEELEKENKRLRKEIGYIEEINEVLKKIAQFSQNLSELLIMSFFNSLICYYPKQVQCMGNSNILFL